LLVLCCLCVYWGHRFWFQIYPATSAKPTKDSYFIIAGLTGLVGKIARFWTKTVASAWKKYRGERITPTSSLNKISREIG
jgi:hypothetical protein